MHQCENTREAEVEELLESYIRCQDFFKFERRTLLNKIMIIQLLYTL